MQHQLLVYCSEKLGSGVRKLMAHAGQHEVATAAASNIIDRQQ